MTFKEDIIKFSFNKTFLCCLFIKIIAGTFFASHYLTGYFAPFVKYFVSSGFQNPWDYFYSVGELKAFPYPPLMLLVLSIPYTIISPFTALNWQDIGFVDLFLMRLPILIADISIYLVLVQWFRNHFKKVLWLYWCSPIVFYISYYHGQLDAVPTAIFLLSLYFLFSKEYILSSIILSMALATKGHLFIAVPFYLVYCWRQGLSIKRFAFLLFIIATGYFVFVGPVIFTEGYKHLVIKASEQGNIFVLRFPFDLERVGLNMLLAPAALFILFMRFIAFEKLNRDVAILYFAMIFVVLVILVPPMPGWYYWAYPFLVYFYIRNPNVSKFPLAIFSFLYLFYFLTYEKTDIFESWGLLNRSIAELPSPVELFKTLNLGKRVASDFIFTLLQSSVVVIAYWIYREGIVSNELYKPKKKPVMIGVGGDSGVGKDTTFNCFKNILGDENCIAVSGDDYHKWPRGHQEWKVYTHLHAYGNKLHEQLKHAIALKDGKSVVKVSYDHDKGTFTHPEQVDAGKIIFFIGLHPFYIEQMRRLYEIKIYIEPDEILRRYWKICRDMKERGYTAMQVIEQIEKRLTDSDKFIKPQKQFADIIINFSSVNEIDFENIKLEEDLRLKLKLTVNNSIYLEDIIDVLQGMPTLSINFRHEDDLKYQTLEVTGSITEKEVSDAANKVIPNLYELTAAKPLWMKNYFGILQLVFLKYLSDVLRHNNDTNRIS
ncbi:MAG: hypothetical protein A3H98_14090 [Bacteroidetes bacterium RIFCSPLOWO2_02_FULL_36_8]|nr:MAG: hypothetical protein A3H98_14090 [Bacteroidetes bacterium RIFCSPLOWO2_02_FULL_36_8]